jgi:hypothetical protein
LILVSDWNPIDALWKIPVLETKYSLKRLYSLKLGEMGSFLVQVKSTRTKSMYISTVQCDKAVPTVFTLCHCSRTLYC